MTDDGLGGARDAARIETLRSYRILDTPAEPGFDSIVQLASQACNAPIALVTLVDAERQWFKAKVGIELCETVLDQSVCAYALGQQELLVIPDLSKDPRTRNNPLVTGGSHLRFYAGAPLVAPNGHVLGTLCVVDDVPRPDGLAPGQAAILSTLARDVMDRLDGGRKGSANPTSTHKTEAEPNKPADPLSAVRVEVEEPAAEKRSVGAMLKRLMGKS